MQRLRGGSACGGRFLGALLALSILAGAAWTVAGPVGRAAGSSTAGYWLVGTDGGVFSFGRAAFMGSTGDIPLNQPIVGMAPTPAGRGYWMVASDGGLFAFGDAGFFGSMGGTPLNKPVVAMAATPSGRGYWMVASDGGIFAFGDALFHGTTAGQKLTKPIVDIAPTPSGGGYWMVASDGGIFAFGDAAFHGAVEGDLEKRIHAMAPSPTGGGYWLVGGDGRVLAFGDAPAFGSAEGVADKRVIDIAPAGGGRGYYVTTSSGKVIPFGDAPFLGGTDGMKLNSRIVTLATASATDPPVPGDDLGTVAEDRPVTLDVLANDTSPTGGILSLASVGAPAHGTAGALDGKVEYRPAPDYHGPDALTYVVANEAGERATGTVTISVTPVDDKPALEDDTVAAAEDAPVTVPVLANDAGLGDGVEGVTVDKQPGRGAAAVNGDWTITYTPRADFSGSDTLRYRVTDADGDSGTATLTLRVAPGNDVPVAVDDGPVTVEGGRAVTVKVLENDQPGDGKPQIRLVDPATGGPTTARVNTESGEFKRATGGIYFTPAGGFTGPTSIRYVIVDDDGEGDTSNPATARIEVLNGPPRALDQSFTVDQGQTATGTLVARDPENDDLTYRVFSGSGPAPVQFVLNERTGEFSFGPVNQPGRYGFEFMAHDGSRESNAASVTIEVKAKASEPQPGEEPPAATSTTEPTSTTTTPAALLPVVAGLPGLIAAAGARRGNRRSRTR